MQRAQLKSVRSISIKKNGCGSKLRRLTKPWLSVKKGFRTLFVVAVVELCNDIIFHGRFLNTTIAKWRDDLNRTDNIPCCCKNLLEPT